MIGDKGTLQEKYDEDLKKAQQIMYWVQKGFCHRDGGKYGRLNRKCNICNSTKPRQINTSLINGVFNIEVKD